MQAYRLPKNLSELPKATPIESTDPTKLKSLLKKHKLNDQEFAILRDIMERLPSFTELGIFSAMWSEHCSYKSSRVHLRRFPTTGPQVIQGPGENAGIVRLHKSLGVAFKMESHNHPSYIEPYQGAATGVGGILRDVFCMGARPIANLNCLRFGRRDHPRTKYLLSHAVKGIGDYGNCVGVPTVGGQIAFDKSYDGNCLVNAMTVGLIRDDQIFKGYASGLGNIVIYVGSATGRDGIHGATMSSDSFASKDSGERSAVQVGDPFTEKLLLEATLEVIDKKLIVGLQDMGAAGLSSSSFEMASRAGSGLFMNLDLIPVRTKNLSAYELMLSESQERMLMVADPKNWSALQDVFKKWQLSFAIIGEVTNTGRVQAVMNGVVEIDVPVDPITEAAPKYDRPIRRLSRNDRSETFGEILSRITSDAVKTLFLKMLEDTGDKAPIYRQYDSHIGRRTCLDSSDQSAAVLWIRTPETEDAPYLGLAVAAGCLEQYCSVDAKLGSMHSVTKIARALFAVGAKPLAITDCLNFGNPEDPVVMGQFSDSVDGISEACEALGAPVVSGNVSLYNETDGTSIAPTPMIGIVGRVDDIRSVRSAVIKKVCSVYLLTPKSRSYNLAGSLMAKQLELDGGSLTELNFDEELSAGAWIRAQSDHVQAVRDVGSGGVALTLTKMLIPEDLGFQSAVTDWKLLEWCGELSASYLVASDTLSKLAPPEAFDLIPLGQVKQSTEIELQGLGTFTNVELRNSFEKSCDFS
jgi:phosphoribosylformylglycinamidine synthase II